MTNKNEMIVRKDVFIIFMAVVILVPLLFLQNSLSSRWGEREQDVREGYLIQEMINSGYIQRADVSDHEGFTVENHMFYETDFLTVLNLMQNTNEPFILYVGFGACPWCVESIPVLYEAASYHGIDRILYVNRRSELNWDPDEPMRLSDMEKHLMNLLEQHMVLTTREMADGSFLTRIFVPEVLLWNGETVVMHNTSTLYGHDREFCEENEEYFLPELTEEQRQELLDIYMKIMELYLSGERTQGEHINENRYPCEPIDC